MDELYLRLAALARRFGAKRLVLFGSRARGDNRPNSDIDLAVYGMPPDNRAEFWMECEDLPTLLKFDIVHMQDGMNPAFVANIEKDGVELMDKLHEKYNYLKEAVKRLREALDDYKKYPLDSVRDGAIQRFEFCTELAWKTMREYLLDQGYTNINSPKEVIKQAFAFGMIEDSKVWLELLNDRNLTSHVYDEATARAIFDRIESQYLPLFDGRPGGEPGGDHRPGEIARAPRRRPPPGGGQPPGVKTLGRRPGGGRGHGKNQAVRTPPGGGVLLPPAGLPGGLGDLL